MIYWVTKHYCPLSRPSHVSRSVSPSLLPGPACVPTRAPCLMSHIANWTNTRHSPDLTSCINVSWSLALRQYPLLPVYEALCSLLPPMMCVSVSSPDVRCELMIICCCQHWPSQWPGPAGGWVHSLATTHFRELSLFLCSVHRRHRRGDTHRIRKRNMHSYTALLQQRLDCMLHGHAKCHSVTYHTSQTLRTSLRFLLITKCMIPMHKIFSE